ncbi:MAG: hypothetical protein Q7R33_01040 [Nitrosarchaeum sp.]|nr:hypothetical protein [Nitrosarchaeum sp.]
MDPTQDGIDHINIYSKGRTTLGRWLSNFALMSFVCEDGEFQSVEGYWYWIKTKNDELRQLSGFRAKQLGMSLPIVEELLEEEFRKKIRKAINAKVTQNQKLKVALIQSTLPFTHYYVFKNFVKEAGSEWVVEHFETIRKLLKEWDDADRVA